MSDQILRKYQTLRLVWSESVVGGTASETVGSGHFLLSRGLSQRMGLSEGGRVVKVGIGLGRMVGPSEGSDNR